MLFLLINIYVPNSLKAGKLFNVKFVLGVHQRAITDLLNGNNYPAITEDIQVQNNGI